MVTTRHGGAASVDDGSCDDGLLVMMITISVYDHGDGCR